MRWELNPFAISLILGTVASVLLAVAGWQRRHTAGAKAFTLLMLAVAEWSMGYTLELLSVDLSTKVFWSQLEYFGIVTVPLLWLIFALDYSGRGQWLTPRRIIALLIEPIAIFALVLTNDAHGLIWPEIQLETTAFFSVLSLSHGPAFWVHVGFSYLLLLSGSLIFLQLLARYSHLYRAQIVSMLLGALLPWVGNVLYLTGLNPVPWLDLTPFSFTLSGVVMAWGFYRYRVFDITPVAHSSVIENMNDLVIVLDMDLRIVDLNPAAERASGQKSSKAIGHPASEIFPSLHDVVDQLPNLEVVHPEIALDQEAAQGWFEPDVSRIDDKKGRSTGWLIVLRDITERLKSREALQGRDAILRAVEFAGERFLKEPTWEKNVEEVLEQLGLATGVNRVFVFENKTVDQSPVVTSLRFEWVTPGVNPQVDNPELQSFPLSGKGFSRWENTLREGSLIYGIVSEFPESEHALLAAQDILSIVVVPIAVGQEWWGFIGFGDCWTEREWSAMEMDALIAAASTLGAAIYRERVEEELRKRVRDLAIINDMTRIANSEPDTQIMIKTLADRLLELTHADGCYITIRTGDQQETLTVTASDTLQEEYPSILRELTERMKVGSTPRSGALVTGETISHTPISDAPIVSDFRAGSLLSIPLVTDGTQLGVANITFNQPSHFSDNEIALYKNASGQVALAMAKAESLHDLELKVEQRTIELASANLAMNEEISERKRIAHVQEAILEILEATNTAKDIEDLFQMIHGVIGKMVSAKNFSIALYDPDTNQLSFPYVVDEKDEWPESRQAGKGLIEQVINKGEPLLISQEKYFELIEKGVIEATGTPPLNWLGVPLEDAGEYIGALVVHTYDEKDRLGVEAKDLLMFVSNQVARAIERKRVGEELRSSEERYRAVAETAFTGIVISDQEQQITYANQSFASMLGYHQHEILSKKLDHFMAPQELEKIQGQTQSSDDGFRSRYDTILLGKSGAPHNVLISISPLTSPEGNFEGNLSVITDITERKRAEVALQKRTYDLFERVKEMNCLYSISHLFDMPGITLDEALQGTADLIPGGMQHSDITCSRIILEDQEFKTDNFKETRWQLASDIISLGEPKGKVQICYLEEKPECDIGPFLNEEKDLINAIGGQVGNFIERRRVHEALEQQTVELSTILEVARSVSSTLDLNEVLTQIAEQIVKVTGVDGCTISRWDQEADTVVTWIEWRQDEKYIDETNPSYPLENYPTAKTVLVSKQPLVVQVNDPEADPGVVARMREAEVISLLILPLAIGDRAFGIVELDESKDARSFTSDEIRLCQALTDEAAIAIENARLYEEAQQEIAERKRAEIDYLRLVTAVEQSAEGVIITADDGAIQYVNPEFERITGYKKEDAIGQNPRILKSGTHDEEFYRGMWETISRGEVWSGRLVNRKKDGSLYDEEMIISPIRDPSGEITNYVAVMRDISQELIFEAQLRQSDKLQAIGQLAAGIAHEINTPMQFVGDNTRFLQESFTDFINLAQKQSELLDAAKQADVTPDLVLEVEKIAEDIDIEYLTEEIPLSIQQSLDGLDRVAKIIRAMKEFSHPGVDDLVMTDLNKEIETTITVARNEWKYVAEIETDFDPDLPLVPCLPGEFNQVILNLITNAAHAIADVIGDSSDTRGKITLSTQRDGDWVRLMVTDTGSGIPKENRERIFDPFFTTKEVGRGTGQGLSIAHNVVVEKLGGSISFETETGQGTTFIIRLPIEPVDKIEDQP